MINGEKMNWLLFTNIETDIKDNITRVRCCFTDFKFQNIVFTKDFVLDEVYKSLDMIEMEIVSNINDRVPIKDAIYLVCNLQTNYRNDSKLIKKKMPKLSKFIKENIDLSSLWLTIDIYELYNKNVDKIDYCMYKVYGSDNTSNNVLNNDIMTK